ncbi:phytosulfokine receptor 1-like [Arachis stenosperma]|uniref:phytosulfokine receptor 1-like n=1 Tax=Arachis stenosperma TaxID=217475 RepID=UPI0025ABFEBB|nr:phytosulfokine receptor 1-like [Arachis stenosperma]
MRYLTCPSACRNGPNRLRPHFANGHGEGKKSYVFDVGKDIGQRTWTKSCDAEVTVVVKHDRIKSGDLINEFGAAMSEGFVLDWNRAVDCAECKLSDGCYSSCNNCRIVEYLLLYIQDTKMTRKIQLSDKRYKFFDVKKMTNSFKVKLGQGGFGVVYKGKLFNGFNVAVKMLNPSKEKSKEFINEVDSISRTSHVNVVTLFGFCFEGRKKVLIYEIISNVPLTSLFTEIKKLKLLHC